MSVNGERLDALVRNLNPSEAAEVREFAGRALDEQLVWLYREMKRYHSSPSWRDRLYDFGMGGAFIAYILFDRRDDIRLP